MKLRKKPVIVDGVQWFKEGDHSKVKPFREARQMLADDTYWSTDYTECLQCGHPPVEHGWIGTLEMGHRVCPGDWIITGVEGESYPCKPSIKIKTYDEVE